MPRTKKAKKKVAKPATKASKEALKNALGLTKEEPQKLSPIDMIEPDDFQENAPRGGMTPLARGETIETAPTKGAEAKQAETPVDAPKIDSDAPEPKSGATTPEPDQAAQKANMEQRLRERIIQQDSEVTRGYIYETFSQLVDGIQYLEKKVKNLTPKDRQILKLRIERARKVQRQFQ